MESLILNQFIASVTHALHILHAVNTNTSQKTTLSRTALTFLCGIRGSILSKLGSCNIIYGQCSCSWVEVVRCTYLAMLEFCGCIVGLAVDQYVGINIPGERYHTLVPKVPPFQFSPLPFPPPPSILQQAEV